MLQSCRRGILSEGRRYERSFATCGAKNHKPLRVQPAVFSSRSKVSLYSLSPFSLPLQMTYNADSEWRSDFQYTGLATNDCGKVLVGQSTGPFRSAVLHLAPRVVADYVFKPASGTTPQGTMECYAYPIHGKITPDYLLNATVVGDQTITTAWGASLKTTVYNATGVFGDAPLLTFVDADGVIARFQYLGSQASSGSLTGNYDVSIDFPSSTSFVAVDASQVGSELSPFPSLGCMPV